MYRLANKQELINCFSIPRVQNVCTAASQTWIHYMIIRRAGNLAVRKLISLYRRYAVMSAVVARGLDDWFCSCTRSSSLVVEASNTTVLKIVLFSSLPHLLRAELWVCSFISVSFCSSAAAGTCRPRQGLGFALVASASCRFLNTGAADRATTWRRNQEHQQH